MEKGILSELLGLFFPVVCPCCKVVNLTGTELLCMRCRTGLAFCRFASWPGNPMETMLEGRMDISAACALLYFERNGGVQDLIHSLKYKGRQAIGSFLGDLMANELINSKRFAGLDCIVMVPLHPEKKRLRGFNQNRVFSARLSGKLKLPVVHGVLRRRGMGSSQTIKNRDQRTEMLNQSFYLMGEDQLKAKHVLLVDDVVTTGATLEACAACLKSVPRLQISLAAMAFTY